MTLDEFVEGPLVHHESTLWVTLGNPTGMVPRPMRVAAYDGLVVCEVSRVTHGDLAPSVMAVAVCDTSHDERLWWYHRGLTLGEMVARRLQRAGCTAKPLMESYLIALRAGGYRALVRRRLGR